MERKPLFRLIVMWFRVYYVGTMFTAAFT